MTERHLHADPPTAEEVAAATAAIDAALDSLPGRGVDIAPRRPSSAWPARSTTMAAVVLGLRRATTGSGSITPVWPVAGVHDGGAAVLAMPVAERRHCAFHAAGPGRRDRGGRR